MVEMNEQPKPNAADEMKTKIKDVADRANADDKRRVNDIVAQARNGDFLSKVYTITPPMAAILFRDHNPHNRDWRAEGAKSCTEYARRMTTGQWMKNNASIGFYTDGELEDGQHRLSAAALAGYTLEVAFVFGIEREAIVTVDDLLGRHGSDHAKLSGIANASTKQTVIKMTASYLVKLGDKSAKLQSEAEVFSAIRAKNEALNEAIELGAGSMKNIVDPVLKPAQAYTLAYLMLTHGWPAQAIREKLALFQTGVSTEGERTPFFIAAEAIKTSRNKREAKDRLSSTRELGCAIYAMVAAECGIKAVNDKQLKNSVKKELPSPAYPAEKLENVA
jgi:hypothetical protein